MPNELIVKPKHPGGRPSTYKPEYASETITNLCLLGLTDDQIAKHLGHTDEALRSWRAHFPEFNDCFVRGREGAGAQVARSLWRSANGYDHLGRHYPPNPIAISFFLRNRHPDLWQERTEVVHDVSDRVAERLEAARLRLIESLPPALEHDPASDVLAKEGSGR